MALYAKQPGDTVGVVGNFWGDGKTKTMVGMGGVASFGRTPLQAKAGYGQTRAGNTIGFAGDPRLVINFGGLGNKDDDDPKDSGYYGPNYSAQIAALKKAGERTAPILIDQYSQQLGDLKDANDRYNDMANAAIDNARDNWYQNDARQRAISDDIYYRATQKFQNSHMQHTDALNGQYGATFQRMNDLYNKSFDQMNQENLASMKAGLVGNEQQFADTYNSNVAGMDENNMQTYQQFRDVLRQGGSQLTNYANDLLGSMAGYGDRSLQTASGDLTQAGWDWLKQFGIVNDGTGKYKFDESVFNPELGGMGMEDYLSQLRAEPQPLWTVDYMPLVRGGMTTTNHLQQQGQRNTNELQKLGTESAPRDYYNTQQKRYG